MSQQQRGTSSEGPKACTEGDLRRNLLLGPSSGHQGIRVLGEEQHRDGAACDLSVTLGRERREGQGWVLRSPWERAGSLCPGWDLWVY